MGKGSIAEGLCRVEVVGSPFGGEVPARRTPLFLDAVSAGFPSPADDYVERGLDLNEHLIDNPAATFMVRVCGDSMVDASILDGDILVVDRSREGLPGRIVVAVVDGELTVKRLLRRGSVWLLAPENEAYAPIEIAPGRELLVWGVVIGVVRRV